ncbi:RDD family protein [Kordiimonas sp. SCSIO 12610]|uniref:RDD family protein n=1 Tax=Kordiimonas sp. SCSIO 12610 TaxID=2829597 RepID=UPI00210A6993|nr:RDD family protein [Kordiimonas sp. SCSIO 12610]UTW56326.1 RDD family protein [Kordiimonas sp. SCSIO 12610]
MMKPEANNYTVNNGRATKIREIETLEGVPILVELAERGDRAGAVIIDVIILFLGMIVTMLGVGLLLGSFDFGGAALIAIMLIFFFFRNFYFMFFELRWQGRTPGKKKLGIRVIDRFGKPLTSQAIFARNMVREIEIFIPMLILLSGSGVGAADGLMRFFAFVWAAILVCLPMFNRDNLRAGDLIAGTIVIKEPKITLLEDVSQKAPKTADTQASPYIFTAKQLGIYGVYELQTLEELMRDDTNTNAEKRLAAGRAIIKKIKWSDTVNNSEMDAFLSAFYAALRKHLEGGLLMGKRKENKFEK